MSLEILIRRHLEVYQIIAYSRSGNHSISSLTGKSCTPHSLSSPKSISSPSSHNFSPTHPMSSTIIHCSLKSEPCLLKNGANEENTDMQCILHQSINGVDEVMEKMGLQAVDYN